MTPFITHTGTIVPLPLINIDTDMIIPKQFLKTIKRSGLGKSLFYEMRYDQQGRAVPDFVLNQPDYAAASILVAGDNFGCGSSREHAPWALLDYGFRSIIAPSFADIFYNNCFKNGILPIVLPEAQVAALTALAQQQQDAALVIDLPTQEVRLPDGSVYPFEVGEFRKKCLLEGLDDIGLTLQKTDKIDAYEQQQRQQMPWLWMTA